MVVPEDDVDAVTPDAEAVARRVRALTVGAVALISLVAFESLAVATVMPAVVADLRGLTGYALAFGAPFATGVAGMALAGAWSDAAGPRRPLALGVGLFSTGLLVCGVAPTMAVLVLGRGLQGLGAGMETVALYALVGAVVPERRRPRLFTWFSAAWVLPAMIGPAVSGLLLRTVGWRPVFLLVPGLALLAGLVLWPAVRDAPVPSAERAARAWQGFRRRVLLAVLAGAAAAVLQVAGTRQETAARAVAGSALVVVVWCASRLLPPGLFRLGRGLPSVVAGRGLIMAAFAGAEAYLPLLLVRERGWEPVVAGLVLTLGAVTWFAGAWIQGRLPEPEARHPLARAGTALLLAGVGAVLATVLPAVPAWAAAAGWGIAGAGMGLTYSSLTLLALHLAPPERQGGASSALATSESLTSAVALAGSGALFAWLLPAGASAEVPVGTAPFLAAIAVPAVAAAGSVIAAWRLRPH